MSRQRARTRRLERLRHLFCSRARGQDDLSPSRTISPFARKNFTAPGLESGEVLFDGDFLPPFCQDKLFTEAGFYCPR